VRLQAFTRRSRYHSTLARNNPNFHKKRHLQAVFSLTQKKTTTTTGIRCKTKKAIFSMNIQNKQNSSLFNAKAKLSHRLPKPFKNGTYTVTPVRSIKGYGWGRARDLQFFWHPKKQKRMGSTIILLKRQLLKTQLCISSFLFGFLNKRSHALFSTCHGLEQK